MKDLNFLFSALLFLGVCGGLYAQDSFNTCAAIYVDSDRLVDEYSPRGVCKIHSEAEGTITIREIIAEDGYNETVLILFMVAIRDQETNTLVMFSDQSYTELNTQELLKECKKGDHFVLLCVGTKWALPHPEVLVE